jgi:hypothetical protein
VALEQYLQSGVERAVTQKGKKRKIRVRCALVGVEDKLEATSSSHGITTLTLTLTLTLTIRRP